MEGAALGVRSIVGNCRKAGRVAVKISLTPMVNVGDGERAEESGPVLLERAKETMKVKVRVLEKVQGRKVRLWFE